eukprot:3886726-Pleurochrysis_carterae.AAC.1
MPACRRSMRRQARMTLRLVALAGLFGQAAEATRSQRPFAAESDSAETHTPDGSHATWSWHVPAARAHTVPTFVCVAHAFLLRSQSPEHWPRRRVRARGPRGLCAGAASTARAAVRGPPTLFPRALLRRRNGSAVALSRDHKCAPSRPARSLDGARPVCACSARRSFRAES